MNLDEIRNSVPAVPWPGGYPMFYLAADGGTLCATCANGPESKNADADCRDHDQWRIAAYDVNWDNPTMHCDNCEDRIPSAYAEEE